jgi:hypothetical protein
VQVLDFYHLVLGAVLLDLDKPMEAQPLLEKAISHQKTALQANPQNETYHDRLGNPYWLLAKVLVRLGKHSKAVALLKEAVNKGCMDARLMKEHADFEPLRTRDDFQALLEAWKAQGKKQ